MIDFGTVKPGRTLRIPFSSFDKDDGSSITMTNYAAADILIYKDGGTTERASTSGFTATTDFDSKTGKHIAIIDLADNTTAGFFNAGSEYLVAIDAVTVDGVTTGGWIARFDIGYKDAILDTTIATLSSQTSFTLTNGPAEDDALNDSWAIIHDIASAVQLAKVQILDYIGSTKTIALAVGATFTVAVGDNISIMGPMPMQPATTARRPVVDASGLVDANTVKVGPTGSGTAQTAGDIPARLPAALTANGNMKSSILEFITTAFSEGATGRMAAAIQQFFNIASPTSTMNRITLVDTTTANTDMRGTDSAALASNWTSTRAGYIDNLSGGAVALASSLATLAGKFTGITMLAEWLGMLAGKQTGNSTALTEIRASGAASGTFDPTTDSQEAIRDRGDAAWITVTAAAIRSALGIASANLDTQLDALPTAAEIRIEMDANSTVLAAILDDTGTSGVAISAGSKTGFRLSATGVDDILDEVVLGSYTMRQLLRGIASANLGKLAGAATTTITIRAADDTKDVITATVDANGNRTAITLDLT